MCRGGVRAQYSARAACKCAEAAAFCDTAGMALHASHMAIAAVYSMQPVNVPAAANTALTANESASMK